MANGYKGSTELEVSTANHEVVPNGNASWTNPKYVFNSFSFLNDQECIVTINGTDTIYLRASQGFNTDKPNKPINSFVIHEAGVSFNWIGSW